MNLTDLPLPDDVVKAWLIQIFGPAATIVIMFTVVNFLWAWYNTAKSTVAHTRTIRGAILRALQHVLTFGPMQIALRLGATLVMLALQILWLFISFRVANALSYLYFGDVPLTGPEWAGLFSFDGPDWLSTAYTGAAAVCLLAAYIETVRQYKSSIADKFFLALVVPLIPWGVGTLILFALALLHTMLNLLVDHTASMDPLGWKALILLSLILIYTIASAQTISTPGRLVQLWSTDVKTLPPASRPQIQALTYSVTSEVEREIAYGREGPINLTPRFGPPNDEQLLSSVRKSLGFQNEPNLIFKTMAQRRWSGPWGQHGAIYQQTIGHFVPLKSRNDLRYVERIYFNHREPRILLDEYRKPSVGGLGKLYRSDIVVLATDAFTRKGSKLQPARSLVDWLSYGPFDFS